jgi:hypothetical protein
MIWVRSKEKGIEGTFGWLQAPATNPLIGQYCTAGAL